MYKVGRPEKRPGKPVTSIRVCNTCGFRYNSGKTCPSCGHTNTDSDKENHARGLSGNDAFRPKPKAWVIAISVIGLIANVVFLVVLLLFITGNWDRLMNLDHYNSPMQYVFAVIEVPLHIFSIVLFINLLRMRKWAVWVIRVMYSLNLVLIIVSGKILSLDFLVCAVLALLFWVSDWSDFD